VIGALIGLEWENSLYAQLDAKGKYENTLYAVKNFFLAQSLFKPVVLVLEDGHWIDSDSLALVETLIRNVEKYPIVILALCRPNDDGSVFDLLNPEKADISLNRLNIESFNKEMMNELLKDRFAAESIPDKTSEFVWEKSNGNPFFVEQLVLYLTENNLLDESLNLVSEASSIPSGISQIIIARIDRLSTEMKETVKTASVLGREFALRVLEKMLGTTIESDQTILETGKIEQLWENLTELKYIFKHALIRDAVYEVQLKETLKKLHDLAGDIIEDIYSVNIKEHFEELADHYDKAENEVKAIEYLEKAGRQAEDDYKNQKALYYYGVLLGYLMFENNEEKYINILLRQGGIFQLTGKWKDAEKAFSLSLELSEQTENEKLKVDCLNTTAFLLRMQGKIQEADILLQRSVKMTEISDYPKGMANALNNIGIILGMKGQTEEALECFEKSFKTYSDIDDKKGMSVAKNNAGLAYSNIGELDKAMECYESKNSICTEISDKRGLGQGMGNMGIVYYYKKDFIKAREYYLNHIMISSEVGDKSGLSQAYGNIGLTYSEEGNFGKAMEFYNKKIAICEDLGDIKGLSIALGNIGIVYYFQGEFSKAQDCFEKNKDICEAFGNRNGMSTAYGYMGRLFHSMGDYKKSEENFNKAISICSEMKMKYFLCSHLVYKSIMLLEAGRINEAKIFNKEASAIAEEIDLKDVIQKSKILMHKIEKDVNSLVEIMNTNELPEDETADINFELWKITGNEKYRSEALLTYKNLLEKTDQHEYRQRIAELKQDN
jgi:tetratricopeptide (TPR) repeat protein